jgi:RNA polymerase sigma-70 factor (ECF subfamily)
MRAIAAGDIKVYRAVVEAYMADVYRFSLSIVGDRGRAEDATQETFLRLWVQAERWKPIGGVKGWLFKIARNLCLDDLRARKNHVDLESLKGVLTDAAPGPREAVSAAQNARIIRAALAQLAPRQRMAITMVHYLGHGQAETAQAMALSVDALESLLRRGRARLKILLADRKDLLLEP